MSRDLLALDLGSTSVRALLIEPGGRVRARAQRPLATAFPAAGLVEQSPDDMWERSLEVMREALAQSECDPSQLSGIGVVTQRATAIAWDASSGEPLAPAQSWQDQRTAGRVAWFRERGIPLNTLASSTKFEWWLEHEPAVKKAAAAGTLRLGTPDSWLTYKLSGGDSHVTDPGNASCTALYDLAGRDWAAPLLALFRVPRETLPCVVPTSAVVGETPRSLLGAPVAIAARAGDQQAATFAQGVHRRGDAKLTLGTSAMLDLHTGPLPAEGPRGTYALALWRLANGDEAFCLEGTVITAGAAVDWLVDLGIAPDAAAVDRMAGEVASSEDVCFVPALAGLGTPFLDERVRGLLVGITRGTRAAHLARAVLEGVAQRCADVLDALAIGEAPLRVDGGLARSDFLLQALADLTGRRVERAAETETTALGAAYLAGLATGSYASADECRAALAAPTRFAPRIPAAQRERAREQWRRALDHARAFAGA